MKQDFFDKVAADVIERMESAGSNWTQTWAGGGMPLNHTTKKHYRGINVLSLWIDRQHHDYPFNRWASYKQWKAAGGQVRKGEKGSPIIFYDRRIKKVDGEEEVFTILRGSVVFNIAQVEGIDWAPPAGLPPELREQAIDKWVDWLDPKIEPRSSMAAYSPAADTVYMPEFEKFISPEAFYSTLFHELTHWTGAKHRLDRKFSSKLDKPGYAAEELVAELGAAFLCAFHGIGKGGRDDHARYLNNWIRMLKDRPKSLAEAASLASNAVEWMIDRALEAEVDEHTEAMDEYMKRVEESRWA